MIDLSHYSDKAVELALVYGPKLLLAILFLIVGFSASGVFVRYIKKVILKHEVDPSLGSFIGSCISILLKVLIVISVAGMVGIEMTSFIAVLGAAGLSVGMALSGTLQNFAGGVIILFLRPFKVGDFIEAQGFAGTVNQIQVFHTILKTPDNKTIIIPNAPLSSGSLINYSTEATRRVDWKFGISYDDDIDKAKSLIAKLLSEDERVFKDPEPFLAISELADSSVNIVTRAWVKAEDYWGVFFTIQELVKKTFDKEKISIPYPQSEIHINQVANSD